MTARLLIDQVLPRSDLAVTHAGVFPVPPQVCYQTARQLDFFQSPLIQALIGLRGLPQRLADALTGHHTPAGSARPRLRLGDDLAGLGFSLLGETPGVELVWGQVSRPWKPLAASTRAPRTAEEFAGFDQPGFAKIAFSLRVGPYGNGASILTMETRVALTDDQSRRRFRRYWRLIGPFSTLIRRMALRQVAAELRRPKDQTGMSSHGWRGRRGARPKTVTTKSGVPLSLGERIRTRLEHEVDTRSARLGVGLLRLTNGGIARLWRRQALVLTTRGRRSGTERTVPLQYFPDGDDPPAGRHAGKSWCAMPLTTLRRRGRARGASVVREGLLAGGLPYLAVGDGPPLVIFPGFTANHANPSGAERQFHLRPLMPLARHFTLYWVSRKPALPPGSTITDLAGHYAHALAKEFTEPVAIIGISTGGSIAQQFAIDHPKLVRRLVLIATACQLGPAGRRMQRDLARFTLAGRPRRAWAATGPGLATTAAGGRLYGRCCGWPAPSSIRRTLRHAGDDRRRGPLRRRLPAASHHGPNPDHRRGAGPQLHSRAVPGDRRAHPRRPTAAVPRQGPRPHRHVGLQARRR
jgi:pimeloyl-ACP methyl ester carboxylesterase